MSKEKKLITGAYVCLGLAAIFSTVSNVAPILTDPAGTTKALKAQGFSNVEILGGKWLGGSSGDFWRTRFKAQNQKGEPVEGYATSGIFKGTTLRFD